MKSAEKSSKAGPPISALGDGLLKTVWIVEHLVNERAVYFLQEKPHDEKNSFQLTFYLKPVGEYTDAVYICELTKDLKRWAIMRRPCEPSKGINYGYKAYLSNSAKIGSVQAFIANNRAAGMPFGTRISLEEPCCKGSKFKGFNPCCHYRHDPIAIYMPSGWSKWSEWSKCTQTCDAGNRARSRSCAGLGKPDADCSGERKGFLYEQV